MPWLGKSCPCSLGILCVFRGHWPPNYHVSLGNLSVTEALKIDVKPHGAWSPVGKNLSPDLNWTQTHTSMEVPEEEECWMGPLLSGGAEIMPREEHAKQFWWRSLVWAEQQEHLRDPGSRRLGHPLRPPSPTSTVQRALVLQREGRCGIKGTTGVWENCL